MSSIKHKILLHVGPKLPKIGGISIYLNRLQNAHPNYINVLDDTDIKYYEFLKLVLTNKKNSRIIYHTPNNNRRILLAILAKTLKIQVSIVVHGESLTKMSFFHKYIFKSLSTSLHSVRYVGSHLLEKSNFINCERIIVRPAFRIPPKVELAIPKEINEYRDLKLALTASTLLFNNGEEVYGILRSVKIVMGLNESGIKCKLFIFSPDKIKILKYLQENLKELEIQDLKEKIAIIDQTGDSAHLLQTCDVFLRLTSEDGYGNSIREALYFNKIAIATPVSERPPGTILVSTDREAYAVLEDIGRSWLMN